MNNIADKTKWVEAALGVAVREMGDDLHVRTKGGRRGSAYLRVRAAVQDSYGSHEWARMPDSNIFQDIWIIDAAHRLAFARALSPIEGPTVHNKAGMDIISACVKAYRSAVTP